MASYFDNDEYAIVFPLLLELNKIYILFFPTFLKNYFLFRQLGKDQIQFRSTEGKISDKY